MRLQSLPYETTVSPRRNYSLTRWNLESRCRGYVSFERGFLVVDTFLLEFAPLLLLDKADAEKCNERIVADLHSEAKVDRCV